MYEVDIAVSVISYKRRWVRIASLIFSSIYSQLTGQPAGITVALCLPNSCSTTDIKNLLNSGIYILLFYAQKVIKKANKINIHVHF